MLAAGWLPGARPRPPTAGPAGETEQAKQPRTRARVHAHAHGDKSKLANKSPSHRSVVICIIEKKKKKKKREENLKRLRTVIDPNTSVEKRNLRKR